MLADLLSWLGGNDGAVSLAILSGIVGFFGKSLYELSMARRRDKLDRVNQQLREFYGPLFSLAEASSITWDVFVEAYCQRPDFSVGGGVRPQSAEAERIWRHWIQNVFMPLNERMAELITEHGDLLEEDVMPECLPLLCAHVHGYRGIIAAWEVGDHSQHMSLTPFPGKKIYTYARESYRKLKARQARLLG